MIDEESVARWPEPFYVLKQVSSYDRRSVSPLKPGWFANNDYSNFIRVEEKQNNKEYVMLDADGRELLSVFGSPLMQSPGR